MGFLSVADAARRLNQQHGCSINPGQLSRIIHRRWREECPLIGKSRAVPEDRLSAIAIDARRVAPKLPEGVFDGR